MFEYDTVNRWVFRRLRKVSSDGADVKTIKNRLKIDTQQVYLAKYHSTPHYDDDDATVYSMCHQKLMGTQIRLLSVIKQKI